MIDKELESRKKAKEESGVENAKMGERHEDKEKEFPYVKLKEYKPEILQNIVEFYGLNETFPTDLLYF